MLNYVRTIDRRYSRNKNEYFSILGKDLTESLLKTKVVKNYIKGDIIAQSDKPSNYILLIHNGLVKILTYLMDGREFVVDTPAPGSMFGEIDVLRQTRPSFEVRALTACEIWALDAKIVRDAIASDPEIGTNLLYYVVRRVKELEDRLVCLTSVSIPSRLANALLRLSCVEGQCGPAFNKISISQHELASMLPASREKVNRCLREWARSRIVDLAPGTITITNPRALHEYATC
jgi:CRP/FNR family transcriptional regulator, cyclic AMP receptor protein